MTTYIAFQPTTSSVPPFQASVTLGSSTYQLSTIWNIYRQDWYIQITDQSGNIILTTPLVGSPNGIDINLIWYLFPGNSLVYRATTGNFEIS